MSISTEDYLVEMYRFLLEKKDITITELSKKLNVAKPSVTGMIKKLMSENFVIAKPYSKILLTTKGKIKAKKIYDRHKIIEEFLVRILNRKDSKIHSEAHTLEHVFSDLSIKKIKKLLEEKNK